MGFQGFTCCKTNLPILAAASWPERPDWSEAVVLTSDGAVLKGRYDGYGAVQGQEGVARIAREDVASGRTKLVLGSAYGGETFSGLKGRSHPDPGQGHFHDEAFLETAHANGGFATFEAYEAAYDLSIEQAFGAMMAEDGESRMSPAPQEGWRKSLCDAGWEPSRDGGHTRSFVSSSGARAVASIRDQEEGGFAWQMELVDRSGRRIFRTGWTRRADPLSAAIEAAKAASSYGIGKVPHEPNGVTP
jgi:hypothetical protein